MNGTSTEAAAIAAQVAAQAVGSGHDPIYTGLIWVLGVMLVLAAIVKPFRGYLRNDKREDTTDQVSNAKAGAESVLYNHLSQQVTEYRNLADSAFRERNELINRVTALEAGQLDYVDTKELVEKLKVRLDEKDEQIKLLLAQGAEERKQFLSILRSKEVEIAKRDQRIGMLESRQHELEIRLAKDEAVMIPVGCPLHGRIYTAAEFTAAQAVPEAGSPG